MDIDVRQIGKKYREAIVKADNWSYETGLLDKDEALQMALELIDAVYCLIPAENEEAETLLNEVKRALED